MKDTSSYLLIKNKRFIPKIKNVESYMLYNSMENQNIDIFFSNNTNFLSNHLLSKNYLDLPIKIIERSAESIIHHLKSITRTSIFLDIYSYPKQTNKPSILSNLHTSKIISDNEANCRSLLQDMIEQYSQNEASLRSINYVYQDDANFFYPYHTKKAHRKMAQIIEKVQKQTKQLNESKSLNEAIILNDIYNNYCLMQNTTITKPVEIELLTYNELDLNLLRDSLSEVEKKYPSSRFLLYTPCLNDYLVIFELLTETLGRERIDHSPLYLACDLYSCIYLSLTKMQHTKSPIFLLSLENNHTINLYHFFGISP